MSDYVGLRRVILQKTDRTLDYSDNVLRRPKNDWQDKENGMIMRISMYCTIDMYLKNIVSCKISPRHTVVSSGH